ncbi:uncharacterized protein C6orf163 homolog [Haliotis cracherodii]|uniref:uncharacterized protein C6orf163 homolog n=1 Tax=Haliotis cracherodii TaxID=6455 RepID=UPI0039E8AABB
MEMALPSLSTPKYPVVPRRYEETRPVVVQDFTHRRILGFGHEIHRRQVERIEQEKLQAIRQAEEMVWRQAQGGQDTAIQQANKQAKLDQEKIIRKMHKEMDKKLKEEGLKVEMAMQKLALEQVKEERTKGELALKEALSQVEKKNDADLLAAVARVRTEERKIAEVTVAKLKRKQEEEVALVLAMAENKHQHATEALVKQKNSEKDAAVRQAHKQEQQIAADQLQRIREDKDSKIKLLESRMENKESEIADLKQQIQDIEKMKQKTEDSLIETWQELQRLVQHVGGFSDDQASFLMPSLYLDEFKKV